MKCTDRSSWVAWPWNGLVLQGKDETGCDADQAGVLVHGEMEFCPVGVREC